jgi:hypothetical protein
MTASANAGPTFTINSNIPAVRGTTVTVPITVSNNPGFTAVGLVVSYNPDVLVIADVTAPVAAMPLNTQFTLTSNPGTQWVHLVNTGLVDWSGNGIVANISFHVIQTARLGTSPITITFTNTPDGTPGNSNSEILSDSTLISGSINVSAGDNTPPPGPSYTYPDGSFWFRDTIMNLVKIINKDNSLLSSVLVNGVTLTRNVHYQAVGSFINCTITLFDWYLNSLPIGVHNLEARFTDGTVVRSQFTVLANQTSPPPPPPPPPPPADDGDFIGSPYDDTGTGAPPSQSGGGNQGQGFGNVPQTGVPNIDRLIMIMCVAFLTMVLSAFGLIRTFRTKKN